jgi:hypothetical protein
MFFISFKSKEPVGENIGILEDMIPIELKGIGITHSFAIPMGHEP